MKQNCWEYKKCGREPGGANTHELGVCPAASDTRLNGIHHGKNSGRTCWIISGTYCKGEIQGTFAKKFRNCMGCDFYQLVQKEEFPDFILTPLLLKKLDEISD
ncbi:MAG: hypothetical protein K6U80_17685 [Firmicutes bacterium]|nr:hypothetical protein [Bacillota bacterium]